MKQRRLRVYVTGPLSAETDGGKQLNVKRSIDAGIAILKAGMAPLIPHLTYYADPIDEHGYENWLETDFSWILGADALFKLASSPGCDRECEFALQNDIPVFHAMSGLLQWKRHCEDLLITGQGPLADGQSRVNPAPRVSIVSMNRWEGFAGDQRFYALLDKMADLHSRKNQDYAGDAHSSGRDPLANFRECEKLGIPAWLGVLTRMGDKWMRIVNLAKNRFTRGEGPAVKDESMVDTLLDLSVYSLIDIILLEEAEKQAENLRHVLARLEAAGEGIGPVS